MERRQLCEDTETQGERRGTAKVDEAVTRPHASDAKEGRFWPSSLLSCEGITFWCLKPPSWWYFVTRPYEANAAGEEASDEKAVWQFRGLSPGETAVCSPGEWGGGQGDRV